MYSFAAILVFTLLTLISCNKTAEIAPAKAEIFKSEASNGIGAEINTTITANGGTATISSAGAKIIVPAGAMPVGSAFTTQAIVDKIDNEGQGISISGNWTKPITVEFAVPAGELNPQNYKIALRLNNGYWITCSKPKYNASTRMVSVRIAPTATAGARAGAKKKKKKYDLAFAKTFYIKPEKSVLDLGEKVTLKAYAREGFVPVKIGKRTFDAEADLEAAIKDFVEASEKLDQELDEDDLVPLTQTANTSKSDDYLMPLPIAAKEYEFTNTKTGFNRSWILMEGPGVVNKTGNAGAEYIAPKDEASKGKTAQISFLSRNNATKQDVEAKATIFIKDGLTRYIGTLSTTIKADYISSQVKYTTSESYEAKVSFKSKADGSYEIEKDKIVAVLNEYTHISESQNGNHYDKSYITSSASSEGLTNKGIANLRISKTNTYDIDGAWYVKGGNILNIEKVDFGKKDNYTQNFEITTGNGLTFNTNKQFPITDKKLLKGSNTYVFNNQTITATWELKLEE